MYMFKIHRLLCVINYFLRIDVEIPSSHAELLITRINKRLPESGPPPVQFYLIES